MGDFRGRDGHKTGWEPDPLSGKGCWGGKTSKVNPNGTPTLFSAAEVFLCDQTDHRRVKFSPWIECVGGAFRKIALGYRGALAGAKFSTEVLLPNASVKRNVATGGTHASTHAE